MISSTTATGVVLLLHATLTSAAFNIGSDAPFLPDFCVDYTASDPNKPQMERGVEYWEQLGINAKLEAYITSDGKEEWVRTVVPTDFFSPQKSVGSCDFDNIADCLMSTQCDDFNHAHGAAITRALANLHRLLSAQIEAYDAALALWEENDSKRAKTLFNGEVSFGRRLGKFDVGAFFEGFFLGVQLAVPALSNPLTTVIRKAIQTGLKTVIKNEIKSQLNLGDDPSTDVGPFLDSLREIYGQEQLALGAVIESYFYKGNTDPDVESSAQDLVDFLQNGELLKGFSQSKDELVQEAAREIVKQTAAPIVASVWQNEGAKIEFLQEDFCPPNGALRAIRIPGPFAFVSGPDDGLNFDAPTCVDLGGEFDKEAGQTTANIFPFFMVGREVGLNAAKCKIDGFPEQQEGDEMVNGFPKCTFSINN